MLAQAAQWPDATVACRVSSEWALDTISLQPPRHIAVCGAWLASASPHGSLNVRYSGSSDSSAAEADCCLCVVPLAGGVAPIDQVVGWSGNDGSNPCCSIAVLQRSPTARSTVYHLEFVTVSSTVRLVRSDESPSAVLTAAGVFPLCVALADTSQRLPLLCVAGCEMSAGKEHLIVTALHLSREAAAPASVGAIARVADSRGDRSPLWSSSRPPTVMASAVLPTPHSLAGAHSQLPPSIWVALAVGTRVYAVVMDLGVVVTAPPPECTPRTFQLGDCVVALHWVVAGRAISTKDDACWLAAVTSGSPASPIIAVVRAGGEDSAGLRETLRTHHQPRAGAATTTAGTEVLKASLPAPAAAPVFLSYGLNAAVAGMREAADHAAHLRSTTVALTGLPDVRSEDVDSNEELGESSLLRLGGRNAPHSAGDPSSSVGVEAATGIITPSFSMRRVGGAGVSGGVGGISAVLGDLMGVGAAMEAEGGSAISLSGSAARRLLKGGVTDVAGPAGSKSLPAATSPSSGVSIHLMMVMALPAALATCDQSSDRSSAAAAACATFPLPLLNARPHDIAFVDLQPQQPLPLAKQSVAGASADNTTAAYASGGSFACALLGKPLTSPRHQQPNGGGQPQHPQQLPHSLVVVRCDLPIIRGGSGDSDTPTFALVAPSLPVVLGVDAGATRSSAAGPLSSLAVIGLTASAEREAATGRRDGGESSAAPRLLLRIAAVATPLHSHRLGVTSQGGVRGGGWGEFPSLPPLPSAAASPPSMRRLKLLEACVPLSVDQFGVDAGWAMDRLECGKGCPIGPGEEGAPIPCSTTTSAPPSMQAGSSQPPLYPTGSSSSSSSGGGLGRLVDVVRAQSLAAAASAQAAAAVALRHVADALGRAQALNATEAGREGGGDASGTDSTVAALLRARDVALAAMDAATGHGHGGRG